MKAIRYGLALLLALPLASNALAQPTGQDLGENWCSDVKIHFFAGGPEAGGFSFFNLFLSFWLSVFSFRLLGGLGCSLGVHWVDLGAIWGSFLCDFCDFFGIRWIFENVRFNVVKQYFLRSGGALGCDFFVLCFWICSFRDFFVEV